MALSESNLLVPSTTSGSGRSSLVTLSPRPATPPGLPFPTHAALPGRRTRLKRLNVSLAYNDTDGSSPNSQRTKRISREELPTARGNDSSYYTSSLSSLQNGSTKEQELYPELSLRSLGMFGQDLYPDIPIRSSRTQRSDQLSHLELSPQSPYPIGKYASSPNSVSNTARTDMYSSRSHLDDYIQSRQDESRRKVDVRVRPATPTVGEGRSYARSAGLRSGRRNGMPPEPSKLSEKSALPLQQSYNSSGESSSSFQEPVRSRYRPDQASELDTSFQTDGYTTGRATPPTQSLQRPQGHRTRARTPRSKRPKTPPDPYSTSAYFQSATQGLRLPRIHDNRSRPESPQGFFLTSVSGMEETPAPDASQTSLSSRSSQEQADTVPPPEPEHEATDQSGTNAEASSTSLAPSGEDFDVSSPRLPVLVPDGRFSAQPSTGALQRVYLEGLDYMREHVKHVEEEANRLNRSFHKVETLSGDDYFYYLKECDERLLQANNELRKREVPLEVIDSDSRLVRLLTELRKDKQPDKPLIDFLTTFWNELKDTTESLKALLDKFNSTVLLRLSDNYIGGHNADLKVPVCQQYALDIENFLKDLDSQLGNARLVVSSYGHRLQRGLLDESDYSRKLMVLCDLNAFPVLGCVGDICGKVTRMCETARQWLSRDEQFMHEVNSFIRQTRSVAWRREQVLQTEKHKRKKQEKNLKIAQNILNSNREKLRQIEAELQHLESNMNESKETQKLKLSEIQQKETEVDFLKLTLQQTKKNCSLHTKRSKLLKQVHDLESYLREMESNLELVQDKILAKSHQRILLTEKISHSEKSYDALKTDFNTYSDNLQELEAEVSGLSGQLLQLEVVHTIRTSPESLDNLMDRPSTVKLSQSLKERIRERKKKAAAKVT